MAQLVRLRRPFGTMTVSVIVSVGPLNSTMMLTSALVVSGSGP